MEDEVKEGLGKVLFEASFRAFFLKRRAARAEFCFGKWARLVRISTEIAVN